MAATLRAEVNGGFCHLVARLDAAGRARLAALLVVGPASRQSALPMLTRPAPRATVSRLKQHVAHLRWLDELGETGTWLQGVPRGEDRALRRRGRGAGRRRPGRGRAMKSG